MQKRQLKRPLINTCDDNVEIISFTNRFQYYVDYKFVEVGADGTVHKSDYALHFLAYLGLASQLPTLLLNLINLFVQIKSVLFHTLCLYWKCSQGLQRQISSLLKKANYKERMKMINK